MRRSCNSVKKEIQHFIQCASASSLHTEPPAPGTLTHRSPPRSPDRALLSAVSRARAKHVMRGEKGEGRGGGAMAPRTHMHICLSSDVAGGAGGHGDRIHHDSLIRRTLSGMSARTGTLVPCSPRALGGPPSNSARVQQRGRRGRVRSRDLGYRRRGVRRLSRAFEERLRRLYLA